MASPKEDEAVRAPVTIWSTLPALASVPTLPAGSGFANMRQAHSALVVTRQELDSMRAETEAQAARVLADARAAAEIIRQDALVEGYSQGLLNAREEVEADFTSRFNERCQALGGMIDELVSQIVAERVALWNSMDAEIAAVALAIARKVIKTEITQNETVVEHVVKDALRRVTDRSSLRILVNPDDLQHVRGCREDFKQALDGVHNLEIHADRRVGRGGCMIESNTGSIDAKIETQIEQVENALKQ